MRTPEIRATVRRPLVSYVADDDGPFIDLVVPGSSKMRISFTEEALRELMERAGELLGVDLSNEDSDIDAALITGLKAAICPNCKSILRLIKIHELQGAIGLKGQHYTCDTCDRCYLAHDGQLGLEICSICYRIRCDCHGY